MDNLIGTIMPTGTLIGGYLAMGGGGSSVEKFVINFTNEENTITSDKTIQEIIDAYNGGKIIEGLYMFGDMLAPIVLEPTFISYEENVYSAVQLLGIFDTGDEISSYAIVGLNDGTSDEWSVFARELVNDANYVHTDNNFTNDDKNKLDGLENKIISVNANPQTMVLDKSADEIEDYLNNGYVVMALGYQVFRRDYNASTHTIKLAIFFGSFGQVITVVGNQVTGVDEYFYVSDANYVHTDNNFSSSYKEKLDTQGEIASGNTGYVTGGQVYNVVGDIESLLNNINSGGGV